MSSYMRGRLTIEAVNAALDDAASHSEANHRLMAAARSNSVKPADRKRATTLLHCVAVCHCLPPHPPPAFSSFSAETSIMRDWAKLCAIRPAATAVTIRTLSVNMTLFTVDDVCDLMAA